jgi:uncharacterized protein YjhX (UPF0386 family)
MNDGELELRDMGVKIWRTRALDRTGWVLRQIEATLTRVVVLKKKNLIISSYSPGFH